MSRKPKGGRRIGSLGLNIRRLREHLDLRQAELAERSGVSRQTIVDLETGTRASAHMPTIEALAKALHCKPEDLVTEAPEPVETVPALDAFLASPWGGVTQPTEDELAWLRSVPTLVLFDLKPTPETLHHLILAYRTRRKT